MDWTITLGTLLNLVAMLVTLLSLYFRLIGKLDRQSYAIERQVEVTKELDGDIRELRGVLFTGLESRLRAVEQALAKHGGA